MVISWDGKDENTPVPENPSPFGFELSNSMDCGSQGKIRLDLTDLRLVGITEIVGDFKQTCLEDCFLGKSHFIL